MNTFARHLIIIALAASAVLLFGWLRDQTGLWSSCFMALFLLVGACALWMHASIRQMGRAPLQAA